MVTKKNEAKKRIFKGVSLDSLAIGEKSMVSKMNNIDSYLANGGQIFWALNDADQVMACCMIALRDDSDWEIMKFASKKEYAGIGLVLLV